MKDLSYCLLKIVDLTPPSGTIYYYSLLQDAYDAAADDGTIQVISVMFIEDLFIDRNILVNLQGGYSNDFTATTGTTTLLWVVSRLRISVFILKNVDATPPTTPPKTEVKTATHYKTTLHIIKEYNFNILLRHGWEAANYTLQAYCPELFQHKKYTLTLNAEL